MTAHPPPPKPPTTAKLFKHGRSQAVRLPKEFRFEGTEVRIRREGESVVLEPVKPKFDPEAFWAKLDEIGAREFLIDDLPEDPPVEPKDFGIDGWPDALP